ncbi:MAG: MFS transporter [Dehalococcoidia bacterium]
MSVSGEAVIAADAADDSASAPGERSWVLTLGFSHALVHGTELTYAALLLRIEAEFGTDLLLLGILANVGAFAFGLGALPSGFLVDRVGSVRVLRITLGSAAIAALIVGLSVNEVMLGATLAFLGIATGLYHPAGFALLARTRRPSRNVGIHGAVGVLGIAGAPAVATGLAIATDWRVAYFLLAALALAGFLYTLRLDPRGPASVRAAAKRSAAAAGRPDAAASPATRARPQITPWVPLLLVYLAFMTSGFIFRGAITFIPTHVEEEITFSIFGWEGAALAGALSTLALLGGAVGWFVGGHASDAYPREWFVLGMSFAIVPLLLFISVASGALLLLAIFLFVIATFAIAPALVTLVADYSPPGHLGASYGVTFFASFGVGSFAATLAGFSAGQWGTDSVFALLAAVAMIGVALAGALVLMARRAEPATAPTPA